MVKQQRWGFLMVCQGLCRECTRLRLHMEVMSPEKPGASAAAHLSQAGPPPPTHSSRAALLPATLSPAFPVKRPNFRTWKPRS